MASPYSQYLQLMVRCLSVSLPKTKTEIEIPHLSRSNIEMQILLIPSAFFCQIILKYQSDVVPLQLIAISCHCFIIISRCIYDHIVHQIYDSVFKNDNTANSISD